MDYVLNAADVCFFTPHIYKSDGLFSDPSSPWRQFTSLLVIVTIGGFLMYFIPAYLSYYFVYNHDLMKHPQFLKNQVRREIICASKSVPFMAIFTSATFLLEVRGYAKLFDDYSTHSLGKWGNVLDVFWFIAFTDAAIYFTHRTLHCRLLYARFHKMHHIWKVPTPFASHAFHPVDGYVQSLAYHLYVFLFPIHKLTYLGLFVFVNVWTVSIHDGEFRVPAVLRSYINGAAHHSDHHTLFTCNYGQFFTFWDKIGGSYNEPLAYQGKGPVFEIGDLLKDSKKSKSE